MATTRSKAYSINSDKDYEKSNKNLSPPHQPQGTPRSSTSAGRGRGRVLFDVDVEKKVVGLSRDTDSTDFYSAEMEERKFDGASQLPHLDSTAILLQFLQAQQEREERRIQEEKEERRAREEKEKEERRAREEREKEERQAREEREREERREEREERRALREELERRAKEDKEERQAREEREREERVKRENRIEGLKLTPLEDKDNVEEYLDQFERIAHIQGWEKKTWSNRLIPYLRGTARSLFFSLPEEETANYDQLRAALMKRFNLTAEGYRHRFRAAKKEVGESFTQFVVRLRSYFRKWVCLCNKDLNNAEDLKDLILQEQFMETLSGDLAIRVKEREPTNVDKAAKAADVIIEAKKSVKKLRASPTKAVSAEEIHMPDQEGNVGSGPSVSLKEAKEKGLCFKCFKPGHVKKNCEWVSVARSSTGNTQPKKIPSLCEDCRQKDFEPICTAELNGAEVKALRDTGAENLIVDGSLISQEDFTGQKKSVTLASTGHQVTCETAYVTLSSPFFTGKALALVMWNLLFPVVIGNHLELGPGQEVRVPVYSIQPDVRVVDTRAQVKKKEEKPPSCFATSDWTDWS